MAENVSLMFLKHEGGRQAIRIKRFTEKVFLPVRKIGGIGASKAKVSSSWLFSFVGRHGEQRSTDTNTLLI